MLRALVPFVRPAGYGSSVLLCRGANTTVVSASYSSSSKNSNSHKKNEMAKMRLRNKHKHSSSSVSKTPTTTTTKKADTTTKDATKTINTQAKVEFKGKRSRNITTNTMAMAARAHARQQRRMLGDKSIAPTSAREQVLAELYEQVEGSTIHVSKEEFDADPTTLNFDQLYRRILRTFEEQGTPKKQLLFEMLKRAKAKEDWDNFLIIAKIYQSKLIMLKPREASHLVQLAVNQGFAPQMHEEMVKNVWFVYPTKAGYHRLIQALLNLNTTFDKCLSLVQSLANKDVKPYRESFKQMIHHFASSDVEGALKLYKLSSAIGVRTTSVEAYELARKLAEKERWADIIELEKIAKHDNPDKQFRSLTSLIFVNARVKTGDEAGAKEMTTSSSSSLKEDLASLAEADRAAFPFLNDLVQSFPQLA